MVLNQKQPVTKSLTQTARRPQIPKAQKLKAVNQVKRTKKIVRLKSLLQQKPFLNLREKHQLLLLMFLNQQLW